MNGVTHEIVGVVSAITVTAVLGKQINISGNDVLMPMSLLTVAAGSILPDIDLQSTTMGRRHKIISRIFTHRGMTHTLVFPSILIVLFYLLPNFLEGSALLTMSSLLFGLIFGWLMHLFADMFNGKGIPLFWPAIRSHIHVAKVVTGKPSETVWLLLYTCTMFCIMYYKGVALQSILVSLICVAILSAIFRGKIKGKILPGSIGVGIAYVMYLAL